MHSWTRPGALYAVKSYKDASECHAEAWSEWIDDAAVKQFKEVVTPTILENWQGFLGFWPFAEDLMTLPLLA